MERLLAPRTARELGCVQGKPVLLGRLENHQRIAVRLHHDSRAQRRPAAAAEAGGRPQRSIEIGRMHLPGAILLVEHRPGQPQAALLVRRHHREVDVSAGSDALAGGPALGIDAPQLDELARSVQLLRPIRLDSDRPDPALAVGDERAAFLGRRVEGLASAGCHDHGIASRGALLFLPLCREDDGCDNREAANGERDVFSCAWEMRTIVVENPASFTSDHDINTTQRRRGYAEGRREMHFKKTRELRGPLRDLRVSALKKVCRRATRRDTAHLGFVEFDSQARPSRWARPFPPPAAMAP